VHLEVLPHLHRTLQAIKELGAKAGVAINPSTPVGLLEEVAGMVDLLRGDHAHVNLIPMNPVAHTPWTASPMPVIEAFAASLRAAGIETTIRRNRGQEVGAACGQLAAERAGEPPAPAVARRRARLVAESAAALLGERSHDPSPVGVGE